MKKHKATRELVSRSVRVERTGDKTELATEENFNRKERRANPFGRHYDFSFEQEAARFAHRYGLDVNANSSLDNLDVTQDSDEEAVVSSVEEEPVVVEKDHLIQKIERNLNSEKEDGWEAFYG